MRPVRASEVLCRVGDDFKNEPLMSGTFNRQAPYKQGYSYLRKGGNGMKKFTAVRNFLLALAHG
jgi:hypothetical protein